LRLTLFGLGVPRNQFATMSDEPDMIGSTRARVNAWPAISQLTITTLLAGVSRRYDCESVRQCPII